MLMKVLSYKGKILSNYTVNDNGEIFSGRQRHPVKPFLKKGQYHFNIVVNNKLMTLPALDLILSNFVKKPEEAKSEARFNKCVLGEKYPLSIQNLYWAKVDSTAKASTKINQSELKGMKNVFISGVLTGLLINEKGEIYNLEGKKITPLINRFGKPYIERALPYDLGIRKELLVDIMVENYHLPHGDFLKNYHVSYLDGNKKNCSKNNLVLWPEGHSGVVCRKAVKVFKDGKFFGAFDSIKKCAAVIDIPRRRISEIVKEGKIKNGFTVKPLIN